MICLPFLCAMVLYAESVRTNPINIVRSCQAWEQERCEEATIIDQETHKRRLAIFDEHTGELQPAIKIYHDTCLNEDTWDEQACEAFVGEEYLP
jgi:hypothetical protein